MKRLYSFAALAAALLVAGAADAQRAPGGPPMGGFGGGFGLLQFDANNDGKLTRAEFDAGQKARFAEADANKDGFVTPEEMRGSMMKRRMDMRFASLDTDHNGQISKAEFEAGMPTPGGPGGEHRHFLRFGGPDGHRGPGMMGPRGPSGPEGSGGRGPWRHHDGAGASKSPGDQANAQHVLRMGPADANGDGKLNFEEFAARGTTEFTRADTDKNGTVTIAELRTLAGAPR